MVNAVAKKCIECWSQNEERDVWEGHCGKSAHEVLGETCKSNTTTSQSFEELCDQMSYGEMERLCPDAQVICPEGDAEQDIQEYVLPWASVILVVLALLAVGLGRCLGRWFYMAYQKAKKEEHDAIVQSEVLATKLVQRLAPSARVDSYNFKGIEVYSDKVTVSFKDLGLKLPDGRTILEGVTGEVASGAITAIMGPSGSGKTTLLNVLSGKAAAYGTPTGQTWVNGEERELPSIKHVRGFVPQEDIIHENLTVREQIYRSAYLRNAAGTRLKRIQYIVEDVLKILHLGDVQNQLVGSLEERSLSGGQRKRVNIGTELAACPSILFLDEPTSGLDSTTALDIVYSLKKMAELGMTVVLVIHQPRYALFTLFDDILLLGGGGRTVFMGSSCGLKPYFEGLGFAMPENENPADWFMDVVVGNSCNLDCEFRPQQLPELWKSKGSVQKPQVQRARSWSRHDDMVVVRQALEEHWSMLDDGSGTLSKSQLRSFLACLSGITPDMKVLDEIFQAMRGDEDRVQKSRCFAWLLRKLPQVSEDELPVLLGRTLSPITVLLKQGTESSSNAFLRADPESQKPLASLERKPVPLTWQFLLQLQNRLPYLWRQNLQRAVRLGLMILAAFVIGQVSKSDVRAGSPKMATHLLVASTTLALLIAVSSIRVFGADRCVFWRESSNGMNVFAFFMARLLIQILDVVLECSVFFTVWFVVTHPDVDVKSDKTWAYLRVMQLLGFVGMSWGFLISTLVPPSNSMLTCAVVMTTLGIALGNPAILRDGAWASSMSFVRWSVGLVMAQSFDRNGGLKSVMSAASSDAEACSVKRVYDAYVPDGLNIDIKVLAPTVLCSMILVQFIGSFLCLRFLNRQRQL